MSAALDALYGQVTPPAAPVFCLAEHDRRRGGEDFPTVPVQGLELDMNETAAALFELLADEGAHPVPSTDALYTTLKTAVAALGPAGIAEASGVFAGLPEDEFPEVAACRRFAYRLVVSFWYEGARSRPMSLGEAGVALYLSSLHRYRQAEFHQLPRRPLMVSRALHEGMTAVPTETLIRLGAFMAAELGGPQKDRDRSAEWLYKQALPDYHRRRFCFDLLRAVSPKAQPLPLIVRPDTGGHLIGLTPPAGPDGMRLRSMRAEW
ncbi:hypothetical protein FHX79_114754 [Streptomyces cavourensis]|uniref:hypothetical protein n=1 Tax=Streptomyces cavourensis TaxID=67258 RepID=UPI001166A5DE|nr:hypothetical protein [Streptomyces cavourensis]TQO32874.1 hypothetical protein FHX79_114754 [Streptomyces cavourensis]WAE68573.1 hypothetical protein OUQ49_24000 [Streptomyces cavourensis]GGU55837.1 hypothetical protein GCM10010498_11180 [Streptomyces cavourensis]